MPSSNTSFAYLAAASIATIDSRKLWIMILPTFPSEEWLVGGHFNEPENFRARAGS